MRLSFWERELFTNEKLPFSINKLTNQFNQIFASLDLG